MPKIVDHIERMQTIADAAIEVIAETGADGMRLRDVARYADVSTGHVTHYFESKRVLMDATLDEVVRRILEHQSLAPVGKDLDPVLSAAEFLPLDPGRRRNWRVWLAFWGAAISDEGLRQKQRLYIKDIIATQADWIRRLQEAGLANAKADPLVLADALSATMDGIGIRASLEPEDWPPERQIQALRVVMGPLLRSGM